MSQAQTSPRPLLDPTKIAPDARKKMSAFHEDVVQKVARAVSANHVVVVGMAQNPHVKSVRKALKAAGVEFEYLEFGSYFSQWGDRLAIKLWSGWPTFPQVFVDGALIGGEDLTVAALAAGTIPAKPSTGAVAAAG